MMPRRELERAVKELGAAKLLADRFPVQATEMLLAATGSACQAASLADGSCFDRGSPVNMMLACVPEEVWGRTQADEIERVAGSAAAYAERGEAWGDLVKALVADLETVTAFVEDVRDYVNMPFVRSPAFA